MSSLGNSPREKAAIDLVMRLMAIRGKSGEEAEVAEFVRDKLLAAGADASQIQMDSAYRRTHINGKTGNMVFRLPGKRGLGRRMLSAHLDTVPICVGSRPVRKGNFVSSADPTTGLGADDRAGVAVTLNTALHLLRGDFDHPPLTFCWFVQEEIGIQGAQNIKLSMLSKPKMAFNWDGGIASKLTIGATSGYRMNIEVSGLASHAGGAPEWGVSAIAIASVAIADLHENGWHGAINKGKKFGTSNVGVIQGGDATNVVTDRVLVRAEARSHDARFRERIVKEIERAFERAAKRVTNVVGKPGSVAIEGRLDYHAFRLKPSEPCVKIAQQAVKAVGEEPLLAVANGGLDANWLNRLGIPTVSLGCGQKNPHMVTEQLDLEQYLQACEIGWKIATATEAA